MAVACIDGDCSATGQIANKVRRNGIKAVSGDGKGNVTKTRTDGKGNVATKTRKRK